jgi:L-asparaginase
VRAREAVVGIARTVASEGRTAALHTAEQLALFAAGALEEEPLFNAGLGAALQGDGVARVSAAFMESTRQKMSAVMNVQGVVRPSFLAHHLQSERFSCLDALGGQALAARLGVPFADLVTPFRFDSWAAQRRETLNAPDSSVTGGKGTIGCVTLDTTGVLAAVTSTGGAGNETPGRVGDTPTVAGNYCTSRVAVSCTGYGEQILACAFAARLATRVDDGLSLEAAMRKGIDEAFAKGYGLAAIAVAREGDDAVWAAGTTEGYFIWAGCNSKEPLAFSPLF